MRKLEQWMAERDLSLAALGEIIDISPQCLHQGMRRGTFSRRMVARLVALTGMEWEDFLLPEEKTAVRSTLSRWKKRAA